MSGGYDEAANTTKSGPGDGRVRVISVSDGRIAHAALNA